MNWKGLIRTTNPLEINQTLSQNVHVPSQTHHHTASKNPNKSIFSWLLLYLAQASNTKLIVRCLSNSDPEQKKKNPYWYTTTDHIFYWSLPHLLQTDFEVEASTALGLTRAAKITTKTYTPANNLSLTSCSTLPCPLLCNRPSKQGIPRT